MKTRKNPIMIGIALQGKSWRSPWPKHQRLNISSKMRNTGYVYAIGCPEFGDTVKIGKTSQKPDSRRAGIQTGCPYQLHIYTAYFTNDVFFMESLLHQIYKSYLLRGEWYSIQNINSDLMRSLGAIKCQSDGRTTACEFERTLDEILQLPDSKHKAQRLKFLESIEIYNW